MYSFLPSQHMYGLRTFQASAVKLNGPFSTVVKVLKIKSYLRADFFLFAEIDRITLIIKLISCIISRQNESPFSMFSRLSTLYFFKFLNSHVSSFIRDKDTKCTMEEVRFCRDCVITVAHNVKSSYT